MEAALAVVEVALAVAEAAPDAVAAVNTAAANAAAAARVFAAVAVSVADGAARFAAGALHRLFVAATAGAADPVVAGRGRVPAAAFESACLAAVDNADPAADFQC